MSNKAEEVKVIITGDAKKLNSEFDSALLKAKGFSKNAQGQLEASTATWKKYRAAVVKEMEKATAGIKREQAKIDALKSKMVNPLKQKASEAMGKGGADASDVEGLKTFWKNQGFSEKRIAEMSANWEKANKDTSADASYEQSRQKIGDLEQQAIKAREAVALLNQKIDEAKGESYEELRSGLKQVGSVVAEASPKLGSLVSSLAQVKSASGAVSLAISLVIKTIKATCQEIDRVIDKFRQFIKVAGAKIWNGISNGVRNVTKRIKEISKSTNTAKGGLSKFFELMKKIVLYRVLRSAISEVFGGVKESVENLARASAPANEAMSKLATAALYLKNALASALLPVLSALAPILQAVTNWLVTALNAINQFLSALTGKSVWTKAKTYAVDYKDTLDGATGAAKKLKAQLAGFDELNVISSDSGSGTPDYSSMFGDAPIDGGISDLANIIKRGNWGEVGRIVAQKLNEQLSKLHKWIQDKLRDDIKKITTKVASFINEFVEKFDWKLFGDTIGDGINAAVEAVRLFIAKIEWPTLGKQIGEGINAAIKAIDFWTAAATFAQTINAWMATLLNTFKTLDWHEIGAKVSSAINGFFLNFDATTMAETLKTFALGVKDALVEAIGGTDWTMVGQKIADLILGIDFPSLLSGLGEVISAAIDSAVDLVAAFTKKIDDADGWKKVGQALAAFVAKFINFVTSDKFIDAVSSLVNGLIKAVGEWIDRMDWKEVTKKLVAAVERFINNVNYKELLDISVTFVNEMISAISEVIGSQSWNDVWTAIRDAMKGLDWDGIASIVAKTWFEKQKTKLTYYWNLIKGMFSVADSILYPNAIIPFSDSGNKGTPRYATGGFPEDGLFFANSSELVGSFSNGRTAVANNAQIEAGIEEAAYRGFLRAAQQTGGSNPTIVIGGREVFKTVQEESAAYSRRTGKPAFSN